ncbi:ROK family protein [Tabrizicola sp.]|jgi:N-acetylglucosamine kinase|uniref:ROK family protein n=1 Tax=Tabrizicola sp. TaxID=2005166 RepID=UPI0025FBEC52|nr:ROK family protein [Tabrizicola sp.]MBY0351856.1 ROK family protein [Tabrizicola sp.]MDK2774246.1 ROK family protein [Tabrizicola sp.]
MIAAPISAGIDLGGTKIEAQVFAPDWSRAARHRWPTPETYPALVTAMAEAIRWCEPRGSSLPIGISAAGLINPATGLALTSNLPASGKPFAQDLAGAAGRHVAWINDCRALTLSEAMLGAAKGADPAVGLILGTGVAGGVVTGGHLLPSPAATGGEFGHFPLAAAPIAMHGLPLLTCGCGRLGCIETYLSAPGLSRIAAHLAGTGHAPETIVADRARNRHFARAWEIWLDLATEFLVTLCMTLDPQVIVLGGGLSRAPGLTDDLTARLTRATFSGFQIPSIRLAEGGDASGARGAALHALNEARHA